MTARLYYDDAQLLTFDATVTACDTHGDAVHITLDRTAFYPTSGGQPFDTGTLTPDGGAAMAVKDVIDDEATGEIRHVAAGPIAPGTRVRGEINALRRRDHMQQHTGQHILSAAFEQIVQARTVSFHMGAETSTIDLHRELTPGDITLGEGAANQCVLRDLEVRVRYASAEEAAALPLRKESTRTGTLRLVEVPGFDLSACGGTHVPRTGMIGSILITGWERFKGGSRVSFVCGLRALTAFAALRHVTQEAARALSLGVPEIPEAVSRLQGQIKDQQKVIRELQEQVTARLAEELRASAVVGNNGTRIVVRAQAGWDANAIKFLASAIVSSPGFVVVIVGDGSPAPVVVARSSDVAFDAGAWMKAATSDLGGRGGGRPELAQGGVAAPVADILARATATLG